MNCFNHADRSAVGICKSCGKGLCRDCAIDLQDGLACKGRCESRVRVMNQIADNNARVLSVTRLQARAGDLMRIVLGAVLILLAIWGQARYDDLLIVALFGLPGVIFVIFAFRGLSRRAQYPRVEDRYTVVGQGLGQRPEV
jgi:hypothetical protein